MTSELSIRPAGTHDGHAIADLWYAGWVDAHSGLVPPGLLMHRTLASFAERVPDRLATTLVATTDDGVVVGFTTVRDDELEQLFVAHDARGTGAAAALTAAAERTIAERYATAWLAVVAGNSRARRFYERNGWHDVGPFEYEAETEEGTFLVPAHRYEKSLTT